MKRSVAPPAMKVQLARLFGAGSRLAKADDRSNAEWRRDLKTVLAELHRYFEANIDTDPIHLLMLTSGFAAAYSSLESEDFWPGYIEGITRILLCLMGGYPDHRKRKSGSKKEDHFKLDQDRKTVFVRDAEQRLHALFWTAPGIVNLEHAPDMALHTFRAEVGFSVPVTDLVGWYKRHHPKDYGKVF